MKTKILSIFTISVILFSCSYENTNESGYEFLIAKMGSGNYYYSTGDYEKAIKELNELIEKDNLLEQYKKESATIFYNQACNYSLSGDSDASLTCLEKAINFGYANFKHIEKDSDLELIKNDKRFKHLIVDLKKEQSLWENKFMNTPYSENISREEKIAGLSKLWSEIKYNFVNFDIIDVVNLDSLYISFLPKVIETESTLEYYWVLMNFCTFFKDGHTEINFPKEIQNQIRGKVPINTRLVENKVIVTNIYDEKLLRKGILVGDEVTHINYLPVQHYADSFIRPYWTNNSSHGLERTIFEYALFKGPVGDSLIITLKNQKGISKNHQITRQRRIPVKKWVPVDYKQLDNNIGYVAINSFGYDKVLNDFDSVFHYIEKNESLIIDLRNNGGGDGRIGWGILAYFTDRPFRIFKWKTRMYRPVWRAWGRKEETYEAPSSLRFADKIKYYSKPVILLTRPRTGSMAENFCMGFRIMNRGKIIGGPTAGSSGTPLVFSLPGGGSAKVVTTRGLYPDGKEFIGFGIKPDILISPTVEDFCDGYDRILETAVQNLNITPIHNN